MYKNYCLTYPLTWKKFDTNGNLFDQAHKMQERGWKPRWFAKDKGSDTYRYIGGYWEARDKGNWDSCPDIFGHFSSEE